jgi:acetoin utilization deacetylase AcuC-like enzyme
VSASLLVVEQRPGRAAGAPWVLQGGVRRPGRDHPQRLIELRAGLLRSGAVELLSSETTSEELEGALLRLHDHAYLTALRSVVDEQPVVMDEWVAPGMAPDMPVSRAAVAAAEEAVRTALGAARRTLGGERFTYALCRPPGHHAGPRWLGGYCYLNTAAAAVHALAEGGVRRVGVLDLDLHYPNGTAAMVAGLESTRLHSLHAWPVTNVPGMTVTPSPRESLAEFVEPPSGETYLKALETSLASLCRESAAIVVSLGYDTVRGDPHGGWALAPSVFEGVGRLLSDCGLPLCIVQEGGYALGQLASCAEAFAAGLLA